MEVVPVQYYQSVIAIELGISGALLFQIRYFAPRRETEHEAERLPDPRLALLVAVILGATLFGSLEAIIHSGGRAAASAVTAGLALSLLPILLRVLPPLTKQAVTARRRPDAAATIIGLLLYVIVTVGAIVLLNA